MIQKGWGRAGGIGHPAQISLSGKSPLRPGGISGYLTSMQKILWEEKHPGEGVQASGEKLRERQQSSISISAVEKARPTKSAWTTASIISSLSKADPSLQIQKTVVCCGEDLFRLIVMEVFQNKKQKKNREIYMKWKDLVRGDVFFADRDYRPVKEAKEGRGRGPGRADVESGIIPG